MIFINPQTDKSLFEHSECEQGLFLYDVWKIYVQQNCGLRFYRLQNLKL